MNKETKISEREMLREKFVNNSLQSEQEKKVEANAMEAAEVSKEITDNLVAGSAAVVGNGTSIYHGNWKVDDYMYLHVGQFDYFTATIEIIPNSYGKGGPYFYTATIVIDSSNAYNYSEIEVYAPYAEGDAYLALVPELGNYYRFVCRIPDSTIYLRHAIGYNYES